MINEIIAALRAAGLEAVASSDADPSRADTIPSLVSLVDPIVGGQLWPLNLPADAPGTNGVYSLAGLQHVEVDGYRLGRLDTYVLSFRAPTFDPLRAMSTQLIDRIASQVGVDGWEVTDAATDYEYDQRQYRAHFEIQASSIAMSPPTLPVAFVHPVQASAESNALGTFDVRQTVTEQVAIVLVAAQPDVERQRGALSDVVLGMESAEAVSPLEYGGGQRVAVSGRHVYWREVYAYQRLIRST